MIGDKTLVRKGVDGIRVIVVGAQGMEGAPAKAPEPNTFTIADTLTTSIAELDRTVLFFKYALHLVDGVGDLTNYSELTLYKETSGDYAHMVSDSFGDTIAYTIDIVNIDDDNSVLQLTNNQGEELTVTLQRIG